MMNMRYRPLCTHIEIDRKSCINELYDTNLVVMKACVAVINVSKQ